MTKLHVLIRLWEISFDAQVSDVLDLCLGNFSLSNCETKVKLGSSVCVQLTFCLNPHVVSHIRNRLSPQHPARFENSCSHKVLQKQGIVIPSLDPLSDIFEA